MPEIIIPEKAKSGGELMIQAANSRELFAIIYESPREIFSDEDTERKNPIWRGDVFEVSHSEDCQKDGIHLKLRRGPNNKAANYGNYLVKVFERTSLECLAEKIVELYI